MPNPRPLSPHLHIYKPQITSVLSITHRISGAFLCLSTFALVWWLSALAQGPESYQTVRACLGSIPGQLFLLACTVSFFYHWCNGIRHLFWDAGKGLELKTAYLSGYGVLAGTGVLTVTTWIIAYTL